MPFAQRPQHFLDLHPDYYLLQQRRAKLNLILSAVLFAAAAVFLFLLHPSPGLRRNLIWFYVPVMAVFLITQIRFARAQRQMVISWQSGKRPRLRDPDDAGGDSSGRPKKPKPHGKRRG
jgi:hypothetical protein